MSRLAPFVAAVLALAGAESRAPVPLPPPGTYEVIPGRSYATFALRATLHTVHGRGAPLEGRFSLGPAAGDARALDGEVRLRSATLQTGNHRRDGKMHRETLAVEEHPAILLRPRELEAQPGSAPGEGGRIVLRGEIEVRGVARPLEAPVALSSGPGGWAADVEFALALADYGIPDPSVAFLRVDRQVRVQVHLEAAIRED